MARPDLIQMNPAAYTAHLGAMAGFPATPTTFRYVLSSFWVCLGQDASTVHRNFTWGSQLNFFRIFLTSTTVRVEFLKQQGLYWYDATYNHSFAGPIINVQVSADAVAGTVQVYINDVALTPASGGVNGPLGPFNLSPLWTGFELGGGAWAGTAGPGVGDLYLSAPSSFFDLSVTANRRKFQNADLSPVDLGTNGSSVTGSVPQIYLTARGGNAANFALNNGMGGAFSFHSGYTPTMLLPGTCSVPWSTVQTLAMDNVIATSAFTQRPRNLISLRWSDDRGHSFGHPVTQAIGEAGEYRTSLQWQRLGMTRDRVFEIYWDVAMRTALQGCWVDVTPAQS